MRKLTMRGGGPKDVTVKLVLLLKKKINYIQCVLK